LRRARDFAIGQFDLSLESTENQINFVGEQVLGFGHIAATEQTKRRLAAVTAAEIRAVATDFFRPERVNLAVISPLKADHTLTRALA
jgi:predicted Zn-dependent peptidase